MGHFNYVTTQQLRPSCLADVFAGGEIDAATTHFLTGNLRRFLLPLFALGVGRLSAAIVETLAPWSTSGNVSSWAVGRRG